MTYSRTKTNFFIVVAVISFFVFGVSGLIIPGAMLLMVELLTKVEDHSGSLIAVLLGLLCIFAVCIFAP